GEDARNRLGEEMSLIVTGGNHRDQAQVRCGWGLAPAAASGDADRASASRVETLRLVSKPLRSAPGTEGKTAATSGRGRFKETRPSTTSSCTTSTATAGHCRPSTHP